MSTQMFAQNTSVILDQCCASCALKSSGKTPYFQRFAPAESFAVAMKPGNFRGPFRSAQLPPVGTVCACVSTGCSPGVQQKQFLLCPHRGTWSNSARAGIRLEKSSYIHVQTQAFLWWFIRLAIKLKGLQGMGTRLFNRIKTSSWTTFLGSLKISDVYLGPYMLIVRTCILN